MVQEGMRRRLIRRYRKGARTLKKGGQTVRASPWEEKNAEPHRAKGKQGNDNRRTYRKVEKKEGASSSMILREEKGKEKKREHA